MYVHTYKCIFVPFNDEELLVFTIHKSRSSPLWRSDRRAVHYTKIFNKFVKYPSQVLARADLIPALIEVHFGSADKEQMECVLMVSFQ